MKIKVDKDEYEALKEQVEELKKDVDFIHTHFGTVLDDIRDNINNYFDGKARVVLIKRDKEKIIGEIRAKMVDNILNNVEELL